METVFTASSGRVVKVSPEGDVHVAGGLGFVGREVFGDAVEFFQHLRDVELGRWRWPENPDLVVYGKPNDVALVVSELEGDHRAFPRAEAYAMEGLTYRRAARAFFDAHPAPAWESAVPGEVWVLRYRGEESAWVVGRGDFAHLFTQADRSISKVHRDIAEGRRIWPVAS